MFAFIKDFLTNRTFRVAVGNTLSTPYILENGVPQGSVLSVTLFLVAIQPIFQILGNGIKILIYADDILLIASGAYKNRVRARLQKAIDDVVRWAKMVGFDISATKSFVLHICTSRHRSRTPDLQVEGCSVPTKRHAKILGVTLDRRMNFKEHCRLTKLAAESRTRVVRVLAGKMIGGTRSTLLSIGNATVVSRLLYGIGIVSRNLDSAVKYLAPVYHEMIRAASGALRTSPITSLLVESGQLPFRTLAIERIIRIATRMSERTPSGRTTPLFQRARDLFEDITGLHLPCVSLVQRFSERSWNSPTPTIDWSIHNTIRAGASSYRAKPICLNHLATNYSDAIIRYTDGSKTDNTGVGIWGNGIERKAAIPAQCSIFSAEAYAMDMALEIRVPPRRELVIVTDSASCLKAIEMGKSRHPWIQKLELKATQRNVTFLWVPGHAGIPGNENADRLANEGRALPVDDISIPARDVARWCCYNLRMAWNIEWYRLRQPFLHIIKSTTLPWKDRKSKAEQRALTRLRIGHTLLTHRYLMERSTPPICRTCGLRTTVAHLLLDCRAYSTERIANGINGGLQQVLSNDNSAEKRIINFLRDTDLINSI